MLRPLSFVTEVCLWILQHTDCLQPEPKQAWGRRDGCLMQGWPWKARGYTFWSRLLSQPASPPWLHQFTASAMLPPSHLYIFRFFSHPAFCISGWAAANFVKSFFITWPFPPERPKQIANKTLQEIARNIIFFYWPLWKEMQPNALVVQNRHGALGLQRLHWQTCLYTRAYTYGDITVIGIVRKRVAGTLSLRRTHGHDW